MQRVDALLINPLSARMVPAFVPHGLLYIAALAISRGYTVKVYDRNVDSEDLDGVIAKSKPKVVGLGCLTGTSIDDGIYVSQMTKKINPSIKTVWGGIHTTLYPDSVLKEEFVDFVVIGDGENAFCAILDNVIKNNTDLSSIDNLGYKEAGQSRYNKISYTDLDAIPQPAWHLIRVENYIRRKFYAKRVLTINTSRGCPYRCSFCCVPKVHQGRWRASSAEKIVENLKYLRDNYRIDGFQVDDDEFDIDRSRVSSLCDLLETNNMHLKWSHFSRINIVREEVLRREIACGLKLVEFGVESGSEKMLEFLKKGQTVEQITQAYSICKKLHLKASALFMVGLPGEGIEDVNKTVDLIKRLNPHLTICTTFKPYPGTEMFDYCINRNLFHYPDKLEDIAGAYSREINTSAIPDKIIRRIKRHFDLNNIYQEARYCISTGDFGLIIYYLRSRFISVFKEYVRKLVLS